MIHTAQRYTKTLPTVAAIGAPQGAPEPLATVLPVGDTPGEVERIWKDWLKYVKMLEKDCKKW